MDPERNLLFGVVALQNGVVDADRLAETCADWVGEPNQKLADLMMERGLMTVEQRTQLEEAVEHELATHGGDPQATLAATIDGRSLEAIRGVAANTVLELEGKLSLPSAQSAHQVLGRLGEENRERYTLTHLHAKGGMGRVWLARDGALGRQIALKELRPEQMDNPTVCSRFLYEAKVTAQLEHPGIVPVYEMGEGETPYYTMRFVRGKTLSEAIRDYHKERAAGVKNSVGGVELLTAFVGVCHALAYAHARGVIHRDLKGQNIVLGDFGEVMVLDWGLAKRIAPDQHASGQVPREPAAGSSDAPTQAAAAADPDHTVAESGATQAGLAPIDFSYISSREGSNGYHVHAQGYQVTQPESGAGIDGTMQGQLLGTPAYMAPEQAQGRHDLVDQRTDVYGLGAILFEILTGRPPFIGNKTSEVIRKVCQEEPTPPRQIVPEVSSALEAVCLKAISKAPENRYSSASELAQEVQRYLADEPVHAFAEPWTQRLARWARRHRTAVAAALGLLVTGTFALAVTTVLVSRERNEAETQGKQAREMVHLLAKGAEIGFDDDLDPIQKEFLNQALTYFEKYTTRIAHDPGVRLEHAQARTQMGDILRKLGRHAESETQYRRAIELYLPLAEQNAAARELARTRTLLGNLLVQVGKDKDQAEPLYQEAITSQTKFAAAAGASVLDQMRLGQSRKSLADLQRHNGHFKEARSTYDQAIAELNRAMTATPGDGEPAPRQGEASNELALAHDARGWVERELGAFKPATDDYTAAIALLEKLVAQYPTVPRHREVLAKAYNSLALIKGDLGQPSESEAFLRKELPLVDRLTQDYPDRPEYQRELARTLMNLGNLVMSDSQNNEAKGVLTRALEINRKIHTAHPDDVQIAVDLSKCHNNLGYFLLNRGEAREALAELESARKLDASLVKQFPDKPRYSQMLSGVLSNLAMAYEVLDPAQVEPTYETARVLAEKLVQQYPDNVDYRGDLVRCLRNLGPVVASAGHVDRAMELYNKALAALEVETPEQRLRSRDRADVLNNRGELERESKLPGALASLEAARAIYKNLAEAPRATAEDHHRLAIAQYNIGEYLMDQGRGKEAQPLLAAAVSSFKSLLEHNPRSIDLLSNYGQVLGTQGTLFHREKQLDQARNTLDEAIVHQKKAAQLSRNRNSIRKLVGDHLREMAAVQLDRGDYQAASTAAIELPVAVPVAERAQACLDSARLLARVIQKAEHDDKLASGERDRFVRGQVGRVVIFLREVVDSSPRLIDQVKNDPDLKRLQSRPEYQAIMNTLLSSAN